MLVPFLWLGWLSQEDAFPSRDNWALEMVHPTPTHSYTALLDNPPTDFYFTLVAKTGIEGLSRAKFLIWAGASLSELPPPPPPHKNAFFPHHQWSRLLFITEMSSSHLQYGPQEQLYFCVSISPSWKGPGKRRNTLSFPISLHLMQAEHGGLRLRLVVQQST